jgi:hypothetical protein
MDAIYFKLSPKLLVLASLMLLARLPAVGQAPAPPPNTNASEGERIFLAAQHVLSLQKYPPFASYDVRVEFLSHTRTGEYRVRNTWSTTENFANSTVFSRIFSDEEADNPYVRHGINVGLQIFGNLNPEKPNDPMGQVAFAVDQTFGVSVQHTYGVATDVSDFAQDAQGLTVIGGTATQARRYKIVLTGTVQNETGSSYHHTLTPVVDPRRNRLRELWIATDTMEVQSAVVAGIGNRPPTTLVQWKIDFVTQGGLTFLSRETALAGLNYGTSGTLQQTVITFINLKTADHLPFQYTFGVSTPTQPVADP